MQRIAATVSLNRNTFQFEEAAFVRLEAYLAEAARTLQDNPDQAEILMDLEQAVADQCTKRMQPGQGVVTLLELQPALEEIGSVQIPGEAAAPDRDTAAERAAPADRPAPGETRPLQQISEGAVISGVCLGLARYFGLNVTLLRIVAVLLLFVSGGAMILVYLVLMLLLPYAPARRGAAPAGKLPARSRQFVEYLRSKFSTATN
jgi:phage shock protein PspC (stress-responsive transcriptional regulator)